MHRPKDIFDADSSESEDSSEEENITAEPISQEPSISLEIAQTASDSSESEGSEVVDVESTPEPVDLKRQYSDSDISVIGEKKIRIDDVIDLVSDEEPEIPSQRVTVTFDCIIPDFKGTTTETIESSEPFRRLFQTFPPSSIFLSNRVSILSFSTPSMITEEPTLDIMVMTPDQYENGEYLTSLAHEPAQDTPQLFIAINCQDGSRIGVMSDPAKSVQKLIDFVRTEKGLSPDHEVVLTFDGDPLDPDTVIADTELEDDDVIDACF